MEVQEPFNPLSKKNLGLSVADAMLSKPVEPLPPPKPFEGAGIYALYYLGDFSAYKPIADKNKNNKLTCPIYVGKAVPKGARKGGFGLDAKPGKVLYQRLCEHAKSIAKTRNLKPADFCCRYLTVDDIWIPLGESLLIETFSPLWNKILDGFGIHDPGSGRHKQKISSWDILHPGRSWTTKLTTGKPTQAILEMIKTHFEK
jgi:Eco29kI restriction endonuclease